MHAEASVAESWLSFNTNNPGRVDKNVKSARLQKFSEFPTATEEETRECHQGAYSVKLTNGAHKNTPQEINKMGLIQKWTIIKYKSVSTWPKSEIILRVNDVPS